MELRNGFVLDPPKFLVPVINISPFKEADPCKNRFYKNIEPAVLRYFRLRFPNKEISLTQNGRSAIVSALTALQLSRNDEVAIFTTTQNHYVSSCVTGAIETFCGWGRAVNKKTKALLLIHEFGYPIEDIEKYLQFNLPIIEDCAHSFFSQNQLGSVGKYASYVIFSFPKIFPVQYGGALVSKEKTTAHGCKQIGEPELIYFRQEIDSDMLQRKRIALRRRANFNYLSHNLKNLSITPRFKLGPRTIPGAYVFTVPKTFDLDRMKQRFQANGIESSVFYGESAFFIPVHQNLTVAAMNLMINLIQSCAEGSYGDC